MDISCLFENKSKFPHFVLKFALLQIFLLPVALGQDNPIRFNHLSVDEGLSQSTVFSIVKDKEGLMWFGTRDGLNKYDARRIRIYKNNPRDSSSLSNNAILSLLSDSRGNLWVGTGFGLDRYDPVRDNFKHIRISSQKASSINGNHILSLFEDRNHNIWVGTREGLVLLPQGDATKPQRFLASASRKNSLVNNEVRRIYQDRAGVMWIGTSNGFSRLDYQSPRRYTFTGYFLPEAGAGQKNYNWINDILEDADGLLWLGTEKTGLKFFDKKAGKLVPGPGFRQDKLNAGKIRVIKRDHNGDLWVGSLGGLYIINPRTWAVTRHSSNTLEPGTLSDHSIRSLYIDKGGIYWVGTFYGGVNYYSRLSNQFGRIRLDDAGRESKFKVTSKILTDADQNLWVSTEGSGLYYLNRKTNTMVNFRNQPDNPNSLSHDNIKTIMLENGGLWIGTLFGLNFFDPARQQFTRYFHRPADRTSLPDDISYSIKRDSRGVLWVATYNGGLSRFNDRDKTFQTLTHDPRDATSLSSNAITYLFEDSRQHLWVGTTNGLNLKYPAADKFKRYLNNPSEEQSLNANYILCIHEDRRGQLWIATQNGLNRMDPKTGQVRYFSTADGLPANTVYGILEDNRGFLWFSTQNGLSRLDPKGLTFNNYNHNDGLISKEFNFNSFHQDEKGYMYFGGFNGVVVFHPDSIQLNNQTPKLIFTQLRLFNEEVKVNGKDHILPAALNKVPELTFRHHQNIFSVEFAVLNFINSDKNQYAYKLEGFDENWNQVLEPVASYMNLKPGDYTLWVKGSNNDGRWSKPQALAITILPPPWKTWWAYLIYAALFAGLLFLWSRINKARLKLTHELELEHLENDRQEELHRSKINFFANIAHELRTPLTLIVSPVQLLADKYRQDSFLQHQLQVVSSNTDRLLRLLNQLLDFNRQETGHRQLHAVEKDIVPWLQEIRQSFQEHARLHHIRLDFHAEHPALIVRFDPEELEKVFYNVISNAFKFTPRGGRIRVAIDLEEKAGEDPLLQASENVDLRDLQVRIVVEDNGVGIPLEHQGRIFDRFYQAESQVVSAGGFGIGLALSKEIISLHHGSISVQSQPCREGQPGFTKFIILLPVLNQVPLAEPETAPVPARREVPAPLPPYVEEADLRDLAASETEPAEEVSVLLVEDNAEIRKYLRGLLAPLYQLLEAADGQEGWEIATEQLPNLVISDVSMPRMDGLELTRKLKNDERTSHIPVILLTARGTILHQVEGLEKGADEYMCKPFNIQLLLLKAKNLLATCDKLREKYGRIVTLQPQYQEIENPDDKFLQKLMLILETNISNPEFNVSGLVSHIGMSRPVLFRKTKMLTGLSVIDLIRSVRLKKAEMLLKQQKMSISEVAYEVGYNDPKYFSKLFRSQFGQTPSEFVEKQKGF